MLVHFFMLVPESDILTHTYIEGAIPCKRII